MHDVQVMCWPCNYVPIETQMLILILQMLILILQMLILILQMLILILHVYAPTMLLAMLSKLSISKQISQANLA